MEQKTIDLVQSSFEKVKPIADAAAGIFYSKLFEIDPKLKPLFPSGEFSTCTRGFRKKACRVQSRTCAL